MQQYPSFSFSISLPSPTAENGTFELQRKSYDVRGCSTLYSLFNQADKRKIPKLEPTRLPEVETVTRNQACASSSTVQQLFIESEEDKGVEEDNIVVEDSGDETRVLEPPQLQQRELSNVIEESFHEIVEEEPEFQPEREPDIATAFKARKNDIVVKTKITVCEAREEYGFFDGDVLIFPEMIKYREQITRS
ncbi:hypothetical protein P8452_49989 [Trifolium repens]|nr:hypothetical protein P8452_49989 [Trifolium repens]